MKQLKSLLANRELEERYFAVVILFSIMYFFINLIARLLTDQDQGLIITYVVSLFVSASALYFIWKRKYVITVITAFGCLMIVTYAYYIPSSSGPSGGTGYVFQTLGIVVILLTNGFTRLFISGILCVIITALFLDDIEYKGEIVYQTLLSDYVINLLFASLMLISFKRSFDSERKLLHDKNKELHSINSKLKEQSDQLVKLNQKIQLNRNSLQKKVVKRTKILEEENDKLVEYSFINAHLVRAPLANILGLTQIHEKDPRLADLKQSIEEMDDVVRKIAKVLK